VSARCASEKRIGNSYGAIIEKPILDLLSITPETPLEISTDGQSLNIRPLHKRTLEEAKAHIKKNVSAERTAHGVRLARPAGCAHAEGIHTEEVVGAGPVGDGGAGSVEELLTR
jgi:antitoxin component of MazEF toxin-antitoxin module